MVCWRPSLLPRLSNVNPSWVSRLLPLLARFCSVTRGSCDDVTIMVLRSKITRSLPSLPMQPQAQMPAEAGAAVTRTAERAANATVKTVERGFMCGLPCGIGRKSAAPGSCPARLDNPGLFDVLFRPIVDHLGDLEVVLFDHHHMPVAVDALGVERHPFGLGAGLVEIFHGAVVIEPVIRGFGRDHHDRDALEVRPLTRRRLVHGADGEVGAVCLVLAHPLYVVAAVGRRVVGHLDVCHAPGAGLA